MEYQQAGLSTRHKFFLAGVVFIFCSSMLDLYPILELPWKMATIARIFRLIGNIVIPISLLAILDKEPTVKRKWRWVIFFLLQAALQLIVVALS